MKWSKERRKAASERLKDQQAIKRLKKKGLFPEQDVEVPTMAEAQTALDEKSAKNPDAEPQTVDEIDKAITSSPEVMDEIIMPFTGERRKIPVGTPVRVSYVALNRGFSLTLPDHRRGKKLIDGGVVDDKTLDFFHHRYETQSLEERIGLETSQSFLHNRVEIFDKGVERLFPDMKREPKNMPNERQFMKILGISEKMPVNIVTMADPWTADERGQGGG